MVSRLREGVFVFAILAFLLMSLALAKRTRKVTTDRFVAVDALPIDKPRLTAEGTKTACMMAAMQVDDLCDGDVNVSNRLVFGDESMSVAPNGSNNSDPYFMQKVIEGPDRSSLRLTINDNADESFQIWGAACAAGNCYGEGRMAHLFRADGYVSHVGSLEAKGSASFGGNGTVGGSVDIGQDVVVDGQGLLRGKLDVANNLAVGNDATCGGGISVGGGVDVSGVLTVHDNVSLANRLCVNNACMSADDLTTMKEDRKLVDRLKSTVRELQATVSMNHRNLMAKINEQENDVMRSLGAKVADYKRRMSEELGRKMHNEADELMRRRAQSYSTQIAAVQSKLKSNLDTMKSKTLGKLGQDIEKANEKLRGIPARFVFLQSAREMDCMNIGEVMVFDESNANVAAGRPVQMSSTYYNKQYPAENLVDGNPNTMAHTSCFDRGWMRIDLGQTRIVTRVRVLNRADCCQERLEGTVLQLLDSSNSKVWSTTLTGAMVNERVVASVKKIGNNGTVSCTDYCKGEWDGGPKGACIRGRDQDVGDIPCDRVMVSDGRLHNVSCECAPV